MRVIKGDEHKTSGMLRFLHLLLFTSVIASAFCETPIMGQQEVEIERMYQYVASHNPHFDREVAEAFYNVGSRYGIRGDIALCQAIIETGWVRFDNGTAVPPEAHNYCGLGVKKRGDKGCKFGSVEEGVTAMMQHLYAYASKENLPQGESVIDPRFSFVTRGCASSWESLAGRWAMNPHYGKNILRIYSRMSVHPVIDKTIQRIEVQIPDDMEFLEDEEIVTGANDFFN